MRVEIHEDGRVLVDGVQVARTNNPSEVLRRIKCGTHRGLVQPGRARFLYSRQFQRSLGDPRDHAFPQRLRTTQNARGCVEIA